MNLKARLEKIERSSPNELSIPDLVACMEAEEWREFQQLRWPITAPAYSEAWAVEVRRFLAEFRNRPSRGST